MCIYIYVHIYIYIHTYIHICVCGWRQGCSTKASEVLKLSDFVSCAIQWTPPGRGGHARGSPRDDERADKEHHRGGDPTVRAST